MSAAEVLFLIDVLDKQGGAERNLFQIVQGLDRLCFRPMVCTFKSGRLFFDLKNKGIECIDLDLKRIYGFDAVRKMLVLRNIVKKYNIKIMVTYFEGADIWGAIAAKIAGIPYVISNRRDMGFKQTKRHKFVYWFINHCFYCIVTVCESLKTHLVRSYRLDPDKVRTIYNGIDVEFFANAKARTETLKDLSADPDAVIVTVVGNIRPVKGPEYFIEAAAEVLNKQKNVVFLWVGYGRSEYVDRLKEIIGSLGISNNFKFTGQRKDIKDILAASDICVLSSTSEGMSNAILEYMASGKPVIATDVGGNRELVIDGETGILVPSCDPEALSIAIDRLVRDRALRRAMGDRGKERVAKQFTISKMVCRTQRLFDEIIEDKFKSKDNERILNETVH